MKNLSQRRERIAFVSLLLISASSCAESNQPTSADATIAADALKAGGIAYQRFAQTLLSEKKSDGEFGKFISSTDNYEVTFKDSGDTFSFTFKLKPFHGRLPKDGWITYAVGKADWVAVEIKQ
jgi:hypothetical protein